LGWGHPKILLDRTAIPEYVPEDGIFSDHSSNLIEYLCRRSLLGEGVFNDLGGAFFLMSDEKGISFSTPLRSDNKKLPSMDFIVEAVERHTN